MKPKPQWHVLGVGAIGSVMATALQRAGHSVTLLMRDDTLPESGSVTLTLTKDSQTHSVLFEATSPAQLQACGATIEHLLVTTKSYDVVGAVNAVAQSLGANSHVLLLTNGMGLIERLRTAHPALTFFTGTTTEGAYRKQSLHTVHAGSGQTRIGGGTSHLAPSWFTHWQGAVANSSWDASIEDALWEKLAINCVINPLTALHDCPNGALAESQSLREQVKQLADEVCQVSYAAGFTKTAQTLHSTLATVIQGTAKNRSSMLQDVANGRRTEIEDITGYLLCQARRYGIPAPRNEQLMKSVLAL